MEEVKDVWSLGNSVVLMLSLSFEKAPRLHTYDFHIRVNCAKGIWKLSVNPKLFQNKK